MQQVWSSLGYLVVSFCDLVVEQMQSVLSMIQTMDCSAINSLVILITAKGTHCCIEGTCGNVIDIHDIEHKLEVIGGLKDKPKVMIFDLTSQGKKQ